MDRKKQRKDCVVLRKEVLPFSHGCCVKDRGFVHTQFARMLRTSTCSSTRAEEGLVLARMTHYQRVVEFYRGKQNQELGRTHGCLIR
jgi:hypothetical protein